LGNSLSLASVQGPLIREQPNHRSVMRLQCTAVETSVTMSRTRGITAILLCTNQLNRTVAHLRSVPQCMSVRGKQLLGVALHRTMRLKGIVLLANWTEQLWWVTKPAGNEKKHTTIPRAQLRGCGDNQVWLCVSIPSENINRNYSTKGKRNRARRQADQERLLRRLTCTASLRLVQDVPHLSLR
jgi:hypothetical protein